MQILPLSVEIVEKNVGGWYLKLENMLTEKSFDANDVKELDEKMEMIASLYPEYKVEVTWLESSNVSQVYINEVRQQVLAFEQ